MKEYFALKKYVLSGDEKMVVESNIPFSVGSKKEFLSFVEQAYDQWYFVLPEAKNPHSWGQIKAAEDDLILKLIDTKRSHK